MVLLQRFMGYKQGAVARKQTWETVIFISKFKFLSYKLVINRQSLTKISVQVLFQWNGLKPQPIVGYLTIRPVARKGHGSIAHEAFDPWPLRAKGLIVLVSPN